MSTTNHKVNAEFRLTGIQQANRQVDSLANRLGTLGDKIRGVGGAGGFLGGAAALGAVYFGVRAIGGGLIHAARSAAAFHAEVESTRIGLATVLSAVDNISFEKATGEANKVFEQLRSDAVTSTATTQELFGVYQSILGPIRAAGFGMETIRDMTKNTVAAASALNIPLDVAARDIGELARGTAGKQDILFMRLKTMGLIKETAQEWNKMAQKTRVEKTQVALSKFAASAEAAGQSWRGLSSTLDDIKDMALLKVFGSSIQKLQSFLQALAKKLIANEAQINEKLSAIGEKIGKVFGRILERANQAIVYVTDNWDNIVSKIEGVITKIREMVPKLLQAAKLYAAVSAGRSVVGGGLQAASGAMNIGDQIAKSAAFRGLLAAPAAIGAESAGMAGIGLGGAGWGVVGSFEALGAALAPLAAVLVPIAGMIVLVSEHWRQLSSIISSFMEGPGASIGQTFMDLFANLYEAVKPFLKIIGLFVGLGLATIVGTLVAQLTLMAKAANWVLDALWPVTDAFQWLADVLTNYVLGAIKEIIGFVNDEDPNSRRAKERGTGGPGAVRKMFDMAADAASGSFDFMGANGGKGAGKPPVTPPPQIDMRGAKITVKQDFRDADPDNVAYQMMADIGKQASARAQSGFVPALSR